MSKENKYKVIVSERATQMLVSHAGFLAQVSEEAAEKLVVSFETAANSLEEMPQRCAWLTGHYIPRNLYRFIVFGERFIALFQIKDTVVFIDYVVDCRQDYGWLLR